MRYVLVILYFVLFCVPSHAGRSGGHVTTWHPGLYGGGWVCFNSLVAGCSQAFNAVCSPNGASGADAAALNSFNTYAASQTTTVKLYIAPGSVCRTEGATNNFGGGMTVGLIIWGYGAYISNQNLGGGDFIQDTVHHSKFVTVSAGSSTVTLITPSEISRFSIGDAIMLGGLSTQTFGYPPNFQLFEHKIITAITTNCPSPCTSAVITFDMPLINSYKSTWPDLASGGPTPLGGPGTIYDLLPQFKINLQVLGLTMMRDAVTPTNGANVVNRDIYFLDVNHTGAGWGMRGQNITLVYAFIPGATEFDKNIENMVCLFCRSTGNGFFFQSSSPRNLTIINSSSEGSLNGSGQNVVVRNSTFDALLPGVIGYGAAASAAIINTTFPTAFVYYNQVPSTDLTFSSGTFTILKAAGTAANVYATFVPGFKYYLGGVAGNSVCTPKAEFTVTDLREDATHLFIDIDQSTLPVCSGGTVASYGQFHALTATQTNSGPANIFSNPEMVP